MVLRRSMVLVVILAFAGTGLAWAAAGDHKVRFRLDYSSTSGDLTESVTFVDEPVINPDGLINGTLSAKIELDDAVGIAFEYEYYITDLIGINPAISWAEYDIEESASGTLAFTPSAGGPDQVATITGRVEGDSQIIPLTVALNFHVIRGEKIDFYVGPVIGYVLIDEVDLDPGSLTLTINGSVVTVPIDADSFDVDDEFAYGAQAGIDVAFGTGKWFFAATAKYFAFEAQPDEPGSDAIDVDPLSIHAGVGVRF